MYRPPPAPSPSPHHTSPTPSPPPPMAMQGPPRATPVSQRGPQLMPTPPVMPLPPPQYAPRQQQQQPHQPTTPPARQQQTQPQPQQPPSSPLPVPPPPPLQMACTSAQTPTQAPSQLPYNNHPRPPPSTAVFQALLPQPQPQQQTRPGVPLAVVDTNLGPTVLAQSQYPGTHVSFTTTTTTTTTTTNTATSTTPTAAHVPLPVATTISNPVVTNNPSANTITNEGGGDFVVPASRPYNYNCPPPSQQHQQPLMPLPPAFTGRANASTTVQLSPHFRPHLLPPQQTQSIYSPPTAAQPPAVYGYTQFPQQQPILPPPQQFAPPKQTVQRKQTLPPAVPSCAQPTPIPQQQQQHQQQPPLPSQLETHPEQESLPLQLPKDPGKEEIREVHVKYPCDLNSTVSTATCLPMDLPDASADVASNIARERTVLGAFDELGKLIGPAKAAYQKIYPTLPATFYCEVTTLSSFFEALDRILMTTQTSSTQSVVSCRSTPSPTIEETHTHPSPEQSPSTAAPPQPLYREVYYTVPAPSPPHPLSPVPSPSSSTSTSTLPQPTVNNVSPTENPTTVNYSSAARRMPQRAYVPPTPSSFDPIVPHPTKTAKSENKDDDYKLALSLQPQNCPLCLDDVDVDEMHTLSCGHSYCRQCLARYFQELINSKQLPISCPDPSCKREILEKDIELLIPRELVEKMQNFLLDCTFERNRDYSCCPSPDCGYVFIYEEGDPIDFTCPKCHKRYCLRCRVEMHAGQTCESYQQWAKMNSKDTFNNFVKGAKYKQCPQCRCWIELAKGCNHMTCKCGHEFCYSCGKSFPCGCGQDPHAPGFRPNNFSAAIYAPWVLFKGLQRMLGMGGQEQQPQPQPEPEDTSSPHSDSVSEEERTTSAARRPDADRGSPPPSSRDNCQPPSLQPASPFMRQPGPLQTIPNTPAAAAVTPMATTLERAPPHPLMLNNPLAQFSKPYGRGEPLPAFMFGNQPTHAPTPITISTESQPITVEDTAQTQSQPSDPLTQNLLKGIEESKERMLLALRQQQQQQQQKFDYGPSNKL